jgi:hypothetical protein
MFRFSFEAGISIPCRMISVMIGRTVAIVNVEGSTFVGKLTLFDEVNVRNVGMAELVCWDRF